MSETKTCSACGEEVLAVAIKCRFCGVVLETAAYEDAKEALAPPQVGVLNRQVSGLGASMAWVGGFAGSCLLFNPGNPSSETIATPIVLLLLFVGGLALVVRDLRRKDKRRRLFPISLFGCLVVTGLLVIPWLMLRAETERSRYARSFGNESEAIGALKTIEFAQTLYREGDKDGDGKLDYGALSELANPNPAAGGAGLIDVTLGSGTKSGYLFEATYGASTSEFLWFAVARPARPGKSGARYFCANHERVIFYTTQRPFALNSLDCAVPAGAIPVGK